MNVMKTKPFIAAAFLLSTVLFSSYASAEEYLPWLRCDSPLTEKGNGIIVKISRAYLGMLKFKAEVFTKSTNEIMLKKTLSVTDKSASGGNELIYHFEGEDFYLYDRIDLSDPNLPEQGILHTIYDGKNYAGKICCTTGGNGPPLIDCQ